MKKTHRLMSIGFVFVIFMGAFSSLNLYAAQGDLKIAGLEGDVQVGGAPAVKDQMLMEGDTLNTGADGFAVLEMEGYGTFSVAPQAELAVQKNQIQEKMIDTELKLALGSLKADLKKLPKGSSFKLVTPTSIAAVRGTVFLITVSASGSASTYVYSGEISVESSATGEVTPLGAGECAVSTAAGVQPLDPSSAEYAAVVQLFNSVTAQAAQVAPAPAPSEPVAPPQPIQPLSENPDPDRTAST